MDIRPAKYEDIPEIIKLYYHLFDEAARQQPEFWQAAAQSEEFLRNNMDTEFSQLLVAEVDGAVAGFALAQQQMTPPFACFVPHRYAYLMDVCVAPPQRGGGVGTALIGGVQAWARGRGLDYVELNVLPENKQAVRLYERLDFKTTTQNMRLML